MPLSGLVLLMIRRILAVGLSEVLVALFIAGLLMTTVFQQYLSVKRQFLYVARISEQSIDIQTVIDLIRSSVRRAGHTPCRCVNHLTNIQAIDINPDGNKGFQVNRMDDEFSEIISVVDPSKLTIFGDIKLHAGGRVMVADCYHAELQKIASIVKFKDRQVISFDKPLQFKYEEHGYVGRWLEEKFYVKSGEQGLFYKNIHVEQLTALVNNIAVSLQNSAGFSVLALQLFIDKKQVSVDTRLRVC